MRWGRYRSWLVAFTWLVPFAYFFMYFRIGKSDVTATVFFFIFLYGARFIHNWPWTANVSLINIVAKTPEERVMMASSRATWTSLSGFAWSYIGVPFLAILTSLVTERYAYALLAFILAWTMVITYWLHFKMTAGYESVGAEEQASAAKTKRAKTKPKDLIKSIATTPPLFFLMAADISKTMFTFIVAGCVVYYFTYIALDRSMMAIYMLIVSFLSVIGAYCSRFIGKKFSGRNTVIITFLGMAAVLLVARVYYTNVWLVIILVSVAQLGLGIANSCSPVLYADTAIYSEWKIGKNATAWIMGLQTLPIKVSMTLRAAIFTAILAASGFSADIPVEQATVKVKEGICFAFMVVPAIFLIAGALLLIIGFRLPKAKLVQMQKEIEERKAQEEAGAVQLSEA
jgi:GPH family glycoside/pentoside/hexuronide:cation symporter